MLDPPAPLQSKMASVELARIETDWRKYLSDGAASGDTPALIYELMPAIKAEAIRRAECHVIASGNRHEQSAPSHFDELVGEAVWIIDLMHALLNYPELSEPSEKSSKRNDRFGNPLRLWRIWPVDAIERGAPEWMSTSSKTVWLLPVSEEIEDSLTSYLARPWLAHPLLDWALLSGWLLGAAHRWRHSVENSYLARGSRGDLPLSSYLNIMMDLIDAPDGAAQLRRLKAVYSWKRGIGAVCLAALIAFLWPTDWLAVFGILICLLAIDYCFVARSFKQSMSDLATAIDRDSVAMRKIKSAWLATNASAMDLDDVAGKLQTAELAGLPISSGYRALLAAIRERRGRVLALDR